MSYDKKLDVCLSLRITDQGKPYSSAEVYWNDVPYAGVLEIQKNLIVLLKTMNDLGYAVDAAGGMKLPETPAGPLPRGK